MKVIVSCFAKFHSFHLVEQLQRHGRLHKFMTSYFDPKRNAKGYAIDRFRVETNLISASLVYSPKVIPALNKWRGRNYLAYEYFDWWVSRSLDDCDIFVGFSSGLLHTIRKAKDRGIVTVVERGSSHILKQKELLTEEYAKFGIEREGVDNRAVEKELREYEEADYIAIPSMFVKRSFIEKGVPESKLIYVPYGVSLEHFKPVPKEDDVFRVIQVGCSIQKGTHYLLQAMAELELRNAELLLIGGISDELNPILKQYDDYYTACGHVPHLELYKTYSQGSVYVHPSIQDGFGMVIIEAMGCALPVIASANTGGPDIIRDGVDGFVVPIRDVEALKEKILYLYEHEEERRAMGQSALGRARNFTWDRYGQEIVKAYSRILHSHRKGR